MIEVTCQCGSRFRLDDEWAGKHARCPVCNEVLRVGDPGPDTAALAPPPELEAATDFAPAPEPTMLTELAPPPRNEQSESPEPPAPLSMQDELEPPTPLVAHDEPDSESSDSQKSDRLIRHLLVGTVGMAIVVLSGLAIYAAATSFSQPSKVSNASDPESDTPESEVEEVIEPRHKNEPPDVTTSEDAPQQAKLTESNIASHTPTANSPATTDLTDAPSDVEVAPPSSPPTTASSSSMTAQQPRPQPRAKGQGLSSVSREYDDFHCQRIQQQFGWRVPAAAEFIEVDGERLLVSNLAALRNTTSPYLFLPKGDHAVRLRSGELPIRVEIGEHLIATYTAMRSFFVTSNGVQTNELLARGARTMDVHSAPFLLNLTGASYIAEGNWGAAERKFRRALVINPLFAPAHLNLAVCRVRAKDVTSATHELRLAETLNVGNVFGLANALTQFAREHSISPNATASIALDVQQYVSPDPLTDEDQRLAALMTAMSKYAVEQEQRGKILNNLAVHFSDVGKTETALEHFRAALNAIKFAGAQRFSLAEQVFSHMESTCRKSGFPEADEYAFMRESVMP